MTPDDAKALSLLFHRDTDKFATHILDKSRLLFETKPDTPLYISDNPIGVLQFHFSVVSLPRSIMARSARTKGVQRSRTDN